MVICMKGPLKKLYQKLLKAVCISYGRICSVYKYIQKICLIATINFVFLSDLLLKTVVALKAQTVSELYSIEKKLT